MLGIVILGRFGGTLGLIGLLRLCGYNSGIRWSEVFFIGYAGLIRGAIAFGLVLRIDGGDVEHRSVIVTTCLTLVVFTTVFFGATVGSMQAYLFPKGGAAEAESVVTDDSMSVTSQHSEALHPNEEKEEEEGGSTKSRRKLGCCLKTWVKLDEWILRDLLIYNYKPDSRKSQQMFFEMYEDKADEVAAIIKTAATDNATETEEDTIRDKVKALKRRNTMQRDQLIDIGVLETKVNESDDFTKA